MGVIQSERFTLGCLIEWITLLDYRKNRFYFIIFTLEQEDSYQ